MDPLNKPGAYKTCFPAIYSKQWKTPISLGEYQQRAGKSVVWLLEKPVPHGIQFYRLSDTVSIVQSEPDVYAMR